MALAGVWDLYPLPGLLLGGLGAVFAPGKPALAGRRGETGFAQVRLEMVSAVLKQTEMLLSDVEMPPVDEQALIRRAVERACGGCSHRKHCKEKLEQIAAECGFHSVSHFKSLFKQSNNCSPGAYRKNTRKI